MIKNVNIGLMGHVDSGKTSIAKILSTIGGTACFDKSPQSQSRGITLDLGFSTFSLSNGQNVTIVDCPGHASLIRTVLCGAQIIDLIVLVIDGTKGIQAQTAECLIVAEIMTDRLIFVVNKIDLWPEEDRMSKFENFKRKLKSSMKEGKFKDSPIVPFSTILNEGIPEVKDEIERFFVDKPVIRSINSEFVFAVDHCFPIKGQGTIFTGTVLQGRLAIGDSIEISSFVSKKVKSIQRFRESVTEIEAGDRAGICVTVSSTVDSESIDRTLISGSNYQIPLRKVILLHGKRVKFYRNELKSRSKMHVSILNEVVLCKQLIFVRPTKFGYEYLDGINGDNEDEFWVIIEFENPIKILPNSIVIGSKFDTDPSLQRCRIAFHGRWSPEGDRTGDSLDGFLIYKVKERHSFIDRIIDENRLIGKGLKSSSTPTTASSVSMFLGMKVAIYSKESPDLSVSFGKIDSSFGTQGKFNVFLVDGAVFNEFTRNLMIKLTFGKVLFKEKENNKIFSLI